MGCGLVHITKKILDALIQDRKPGRYAYYLTTVEGESHQTLGYEMYSGQVVFEDQTTFGFWIDWTPQGVPYLSDWDQDNDQMPWQSFDEVPWRKSKEFQRAWESLALKR